MIALLASLALAAPDDPPPSPSAADPEVMDPEAMAKEIVALREQLTAIEAEQRAAREERAAHRVAFTAPLVIERDKEAEEAVAFGNDVRVEGHVIGNAVSFGGDVEVARTGRVDGDVVSFGGTVEVAEGATVGGNRVAMDLPMSLPVAAVDPATNTGAGSLRLAADGSELLYTLYRRLVFLLSVAGAGVLVIGLFPARVGRIASDIETRPVRAAIVGTLSTGFLALFAGLFTVVTLGLGLPVSLLLVGLLGIAWLLGFVGLCQAIGDRLPLQDRPHGRWLAFVVGVCLVTFLGSLPWVGFVVVGAVSVLGIGSTLATRFGRP